MKELIRVNNWISGLQWLFFIFTNIIVIPITVGAAFDLPSAKIVSLLQLSFIVTGLACIFQARFGHGRGIMEGQSGLWWGVILTLVTTASAQGMPLTELGGSLAIGIIISGFLTILIGVTGAGPLLAKWFNPSVMGVFMFLFGCQLISIFLKGMLGIPFGNSSEPGSIDPVLSLLSIIIAILVIMISVKSKPGIRRYSLLIGIFIGWILYILTFGAGESATGTSSSAAIEWFPLGKPFWNTSIVLTVVLTGLLNTANTFGALKGTDVLYKTEATGAEYRNSFTITGIFTMIAGMLGLVPYAPYVSSIGFLRQTEDLRRLPLILGGFMFLMMGLIPIVGHFFSMLPLSVGSAVLFVAYLQMFNSSWGFFKQVNFNTVNVYRAALPLFVGIIIMTMPVNAFETLPALIRPLVSNGLLVGIFLALVMENVVDWDRYGIEGEEKEEGL